ncbi:MAG TPA: GEVED domain-containing protein [Chitinophagales bacterium]|nr:GEVED domain-containing protein [Chitinophagales bacterium]
MRLITLPLLFGLTLSVAQAQYCIPDYTVGTTDDDYINGVEINTISNLDSGPGDGSGYSDFTDLTTDLFIGISYDVHIANTPDYTEGYRIWIDYNQDEIFADDEQIFEPFILEEEFETIMPFTVPLDAAIGPTRMRVRCSYNAIDFDACSGETYGEAEDYTINILGVSNDIGAISILDLANNCEFTTNETITIAVENFGTESASDFEVAYSIDGGSPVVELFPALLHIDETLPYSFATTADLSADGIHIIKVWTNWVDDAYNGNDTATIYLLNDYTVLTTGFPENLCYFGATVLPTGVPDGGVWSGEGIINPTTGELDPAIVGGIGGSTIVEYAYTATDKYAVFEIPYFLTPMTSPTILALGDEDFESGIPLGFNFEYFDETYSEIFISSNGFIGFGAGSTSYDVQHIPNTSNPDNIIALAWSDLDPTAGGTISYELQGVAPERKFIVSYKNVFHYLSDATISGQIILYENGNIIDIVNTLIESDGGVVTQGIENLNGTVAYVGEEDYNKDVFTITTESWRYYYTPCDAVVTDTITFIAAPEVSIADSSACVGATINLDAGEGAAFYVWSTGSDAQSIDVTSSGTYSVTYYANESCYVSDSAVITIYPNPVIDLGGDGGICEGAYLNAENTGADYLWNTGDTTQTLFISTSGTYYVDVVSAAGCANSDTITLSITPLPTADFDVITGEGLIAVFTSLATDAVTWLWDFGDGTISTIENPDHTYPTDGSYVVTLVVTNDCGADIYTTTIQVTTGINTQHFVDGGLTIFPNPASTSITVDLLISQTGLPSSIKIYDMTGNIVANMEQVFGEQISLPITNLSSGNYMVVATNGIKTAMSSFIKN